MRRATLIFFLIFSSVFVFAQKNWVKQKLTSRVTVAFPTTPLKTAGTTFALKDSTGLVYTATYSFIAQNLKIDQKAFDKLATTDEFASEFQNSLQATLAGYDLEPIQIKQNKNYVSYLTKGKNEDEKKSIFLHIIFVDGIYYSLSVVIPDGKNISNKDVFLSNFQITK